MLSSCTHCGCYIRVTEPTCPHCGTTRGPGGRSAAALLLGLALSGCPDNAKDSDTGTSVVALYGTPATTGQVDGDGWTPAGGE